MVILSKVLGKNFVPQVGGIRLKQCLRITPSDACMACGESLKELVADVMDELEYIPGHYVVNQLTRPRLACTCGEKIVQSKMPSRPILKSFVGQPLWPILCAANMAIIYRCIARAKCLRTKAMT